MQFLNCFYSLNNSEWIVCRSFSTAVIFIAFFFSFSLYISADGIVQAAEVNADGIGRDASTLVHKIKAAQYVRQHPGEVCPAKWEEGSETLQPGLDLVGKI